MYTYQKAEQSQELQSSQGGHPQAALDSIFGNINRVNDYTNYMAVPSAWRPPLCCA